MNLKFRNKKYNSKIKFHFRKENSKIQKIHSKIENSTQNLKIYFEREFPKFRYVFWKFKSKNIFQKRSSKILKYIFFSTLSFYIKSFSLFHDIFVILMTNRMQLKLIQYRNIFFLFSNWKKMFFFPFLLYYKLKNIVMTIFFFIFDKNKLEKNK